MALGSSVAIQAMLPETMGLGFRVQGLGFRGLGFRVLEFRVLGFRV